MLASEGIKRTELGREEFTKRVWEWKEKYVFYLGFNMLIAFKIGPFCPLWIFSF